MHIWFNYAAGILVVITLFNVYLRCFVCPVSAGNKVFDGGWDVVRESGRHLVSIQCPLLQQATHDH